ncbi:MAG: hypothetical protein IPJ30_15075 [Acidobacteria bacterium]|nr:hypothetical protein [Acidobacteriota bacterium]
MTPQDLIRKKRDGARFSENEIEAFIAGVSDGSWADYQITALVMAMFIHGLNMSEQNALVRAMLHSGETLDFSDIDAPVADKHSTGGVGDKTSLIIAPLAAACGVAVPMISGRGLGHTGGTLDKLESIDGYNVRLSSAKIKRTLKKCGFALAGQTKRIVPADRKLYALRDACAMVESGAVDRRIDYVEKACRGSRRARSRRQDRQRRVDGKPLGRARPREIYGCRRNRFRGQDRGRDNQYERAARTLRGQCARGLRMSEDNARRGRRTLSTDARPVA